jgi:hypothetical protein
MKCYICEKTPGPGGTHYHIKDAVGICHHCGVAVCLEHSYKDNLVGSPLLCPECAKMETVKPVSEPVMEAAQ